MKEFLWYAFAFLAVGGGVAMVTRKNPVASLLFLILTFFSLAGIFILLQAHFIAAIQVLVYAGAIMVLFLFVIMLLNLGHDYRSDLRGGGWIVIGFAGAGLFGFFVSRAFRGPDLVVDHGGAALIDRAVAEFGAVGAIGIPLIREYVVPFELTALLLLAAIIGAVVLAKRRV